MKFFAKSYSFLILFTWFIIQKFLSIKYLIKKRFKIYFKNIPAFIKFQVSNSTFKIY